MGNKIPVATVSIYKGRDKSESATSTLGFLDLALR
jgi:hypothetical protein